MGVDAPVPDPADTSTAESAAAKDSAPETAKDLSSDVSRRTDRTSYSIPDDGSPITISTRRKRQDREREAESALTRASHQSQTSLLIEYFEGGKGGKDVHARPSVRVKVTPSAARKIKDSRDHIQISETGKDRQPSYTKRISLSPRLASDRRPPIGESGDDRSLSSYASATEESSLTPRGPPVEIEVMHKDGPRSAASSPRDRRYVQPNASEISSMPPDSFLEGQPGQKTPRRERSRSLSRDDAATVATSERLKTPSRRRSRSLSRERIAQKVIEKLGTRHLAEAKAGPAESSGKQKRPSKSRSRSVSKEHVELVKSPRRKSGRGQRDDELTSGAESSLLTTSGLSSHRRSADQHSIRSGTSKSSINNPRLLETVEDAIRRLILPELNALKDEHRSHHDRAGARHVVRDSATSAESASLDDGRRRASKASQAPGRPKVVLNRDENGPGLVLSGDSVKGRRERKGHRGTSGSPSDSHDRGLSEETVVEEKARKKRSKDKHGLRDAAAQGAAGALTAAALRHHDSRSSVEKEERRRRRTKSRSRSASLAESMETPRKHDVPPMPMSSDVQGSEVTRQSILTERTDRPRSATSQERHTPVREPASPALRTPTKTSASTQRALDTHHSNTSRGDLSLHSVPSDRSIRKDAQRSRAVAAAAAANEHEHATYQERENASGQNRALSPIQSVASYKDDSLAGGDAHRSFLHTESNGTLSSAGKEYRTRDAGLAMESAVSSPLDRSATSPRLSGGAAEDDADRQYWHEQHEENERNRSLDEGGRRDPIIEVKHMTNYTDDSAEAAYLDKGQHVLGVGANPEYRHTPVAVSSAVASLHEPSLVGARSNVSGHSKAGDAAYADSMDEYHDDGQYQEDSDRALSLSQRDSPSKSGHHAGPGHAQASFQQRSLGGSPQKDAGRARNERDEYVHLGASGLPIADDPMPEIGHGLSDESDINTNPSIIQGPIGGVQHENRDHWPYEPTPPHSDGNLLGGRGALDDRAIEAGPLAAAAPPSGQDRGLGLSHDDYGYEQDRHAKDPYGPGDGLGEGVGHDFGPMRDTYQGGHGVQGTPLKDEGYISSANPRSPGAVTPEPRSKRLNLFGASGMAGMADDADDPFTGKGHARHLSGNSHGMASPLYDSATGKGIDRIQSKDIVALMDHLTVRDAQRNARDTEILVTLVRSAAEMRNSFEDMKRFLADQEDHIISSTEKNTDRSIQKVMHGPRPQPLGTPRAPRRTPAEEEAMEDLPAKRRNVFKRALKGLSMRSTNDLAKIEDMLVQLLGDVEGLKAAQELRPGGTQGNSLDSYDNLQAVPEGYEPEGQAGTGSTNQSGSGYFSQPQTRQPSATRGLDGRKASEHRISTVPEGDEELQAYEEEPFEREDERQTPTRQSPLFQPDQYLSAAHEPSRGVSLPLDTPPQTHAPTGAHSHENTPRTEGSRKHKSNSSSFFPKISRWSETTASTVARQFRGSGARRKEYSEPASRSGSDVASWGDVQHDPRGADALPGSYPREATPTGPERRPSSPLLPQDGHDGPRYQAHRNSLNLQHPQPRPGPTYRYQNQLESQADKFGYAPSVASDKRLSGASANPRHSGGAGNLSPVSDGGFSQASAAEQTAPPRPPKIPDEPLLPARKATTAGQGGAQYAGGQLDATRYSDGSQYSGGVSRAKDVPRMSLTAQMNGSPRSASGQVPQRKPTGPRPIASSGTDNAARRNRHRGALY
ncbi:MAG: hypothetical protein M1832_002580 [Thelocarpon impressellum]|nr:MAG: hypothetical protein M1832_002580 [Thelocarpon impressellum]